MKRTSVCFAFASFLFSPTAAAVSIHIHGIDGGLYDNVAAYLTPYGELDLDQIRPQRVQLQVKQALQPFGYYEPNVTLSRNGETDLDIVVEPGAPVINADVDIVVSGDAREDPDIQKLLLKNTPQVGERLDHQTYDHLKSKLYSLALRKGYFDYEVKKASVKVSPERHQAFITLHIDSGARYRFGHTIVNNSQIEPERLLSLAGFEDGERFDSEKLSEFQATLSSTEWFKQVKVHPDFQSTRMHPHQVDIVADVEPAKRNQVKVGGGFETDLGPRASLGWDLPWYNAKGHSLASLATLSRQEQSLNLAYKMPTQDVLGDFYRVEFNAKSWDHLDTQSDTFELSLDKTWRLNQRWQGQFYVKYLSERYTQASLSDHSQLFLPGVAFSYLDRKSQSSRLAQRHVYAVEAASDDLLSDVSVMRVTGESMVSWSLSPKQAFHLRTNLGANLTSQIDALPASLRFFAGGDGTVRGYEYQSLSPKNEAGELTGGRYLFALGAEYQYKVWNHVWLGGFYDMGDAFDDQFEPKHGVGLSVIWDNRYAPIKFDIAKSVGDASQDDFRLHLKIGAQF
ncbi:outer membrane protein assembly factor [Vibrio cholerae]